MGRVQQQQGYTAQEHHGSPACTLPVWVRGGQHELELDYARVVLQLPMLHTVQLVRDVSPPDVHLGEPITGCHLKSLSKATWGSR